jgi:arylsulfatase A
MNTSQFAFGGIYGRSLGRVVAGLVLFSSIALTVAARPPNFVVIFADDLGYGDLGCYGHPSIRTPNLDRMAVEGMKFTDFYVAACVCTPSRAALLTGRLPIRNGMAGSEKRRVLYPDSQGGLPPEEITIAKALKAKGYATACIGKWHLGHNQPHQPTSHGFDLFFGFPYSNDMDRIPSAKGANTGSMEPRYTDFNVPLLRNGEVVERPAVQTTLTRRYTEEAVKFIREHKRQPFFLYFPHTFPHVPLFASEKFKGVSRRGLYGDTVEELDWSVGEVIEALRWEKLSDNTLVLFTSDNGPWLVRDLAGGSAGLLRDGKGSTWEGGMRVPALAWWPGKIKAGVVRNDLASTLDLFPTFLKLAGAPLPNDRVFDGYDLSAVLLDRGAGPRQEMFFYRGDELYAVRQGLFKAEFVTRDGYSKVPAEKHEPPLLFHLGKDPSEKYNVAGQHPEVVREIQALAEQHKASLKPVTPQY